MARLLGAALILGSLLVSIVLVWVLHTYRQADQLTGGGMIAIGLILGMTLVLPQLGLGIYLLRGSVSPDDNA